MGFDENVIERAYVCFKSLTYCFRIVNGSFLIQKCPDYEMKINGFLWLILQIR